MGLPSGQEVKKGKNFGFGALGDLGIRMLCLWYCNPICLMIT